MHYHDPVFNNLLPSTELDERVDKAYPQKMAKFKDRWKERAKNNRGLGLNLGQFNLENQRPVRQRTRRIFPNGYRKVNLYGQVKRADELVHECMLKMVRSTEERDGEDLRLFTTVHGPSS